MESHPLSECSGALDNEGILLVKPRSSDSFEKNFAVPGNESVMNKREAHPPKPSKVEAASSSLCAFMGAGAHWWNAFDCCGKREIDQMGESEQESYLYGVPEDEAAGDPGFFSEFFTPHEAPLDPPQFNDFFLDPNAEQTPEAAMRQPSYHAPDPEQNANSD